MSNILRTLGKEGYCQAELDKLFSGIVLPKIMYGISVYCSSSPELPYNIFWIVVINEDIRALLFPLLIANKSRIKVF